MEHRGSIGEDAGLLVGTLVEPLDLDHRGQSLHGTRKTTTTVVALHKDLAHTGTLQHLGDHRLGHLHRLTRIDRIGDIDHPVGIDLIGQRAEIVVTRIGRVGIGSTAYNLARKVVVFA